MKTDNDDKDIHDLTEEEMAAMKDEEGGADPDGDGAASEADGTGAEGDGQKETPAKAEGEKVDDKDDQGDKDDDGEEYERAPPEQPPLRAQAAEGLEEQLKKLSEDEADLETKFDDGDITAADYRKGLREIGDKRSNLQWEQRKADLATDLQNQANTNAWERDVHDFMTGPAAHLTKSKALLTGFDEHVKAVTGDPANANLSNTSQLRKAYKAFAEELESVGVKIEALKPNQDKGGDKEKVADKADKTEKPSKPAKSKREIPPTLGKVPQVDIDPIDDGKYADLDRLAKTDPEAYEREIAKLQERGEFDSYANTAD